jgi:hypothetical protein
MDPVRRRTFRGDSESPGVKVVNVAPDRDLNVGRSRGQLFVDGHQLLKASPQHYECYWDLSITDLLERSEPVSSN